MVEFKPYEYQKKSTQWILDKPRCGLFLDMSLGKTVCTLTAIRDLMYDRLEISKVLVIAPKRVAVDTWPKEIKKWEHLKDLRISVAVGDAKTRKSALKKDADIYVINRENVTWLLDNYEFDFDMVVIDELSSFKSTNAQRFRALKKVIGRADRVVGLTGTPAPNGLIDLWPQMYLIDRGERLGRTVTKYRNEYFRPGRGNGHIVYEYVLRRGAEDEIYEKIGDICLSMKKEDYLELPDKIFQDVEVELPKEASKYYLEMEKKEILKLSEDEVILAVNAAAASNKLQQIANGSVYDDERRVVNIHEAKIDALEDLVEQANGKPILVFYSFKHDEESIRKRIPTVRKIETSGDIDEWNNGRIPVAVAHPASIGHGLNLQFGGHIIVWFGLTWSLEMYLQANDRLHRQGQKNPVTIYRLCAKDTVDERILTALDKKEKGQDALMQYLKAKAKELRS